MHSASLLGTTEQMLITALCRFVEMAEAAVRAVVPRVKDIPGPYRFFFYSFDCHERKHVHVRREWMVCKFWLTPVTLAANHGFSAHEMNAIRSYIEDYLSQLLEAWDEHGGS